MNNFFLGFLVLVIILTPLQALVALSADWVHVPKSQYGKQLWDKNSIKKILMVLPGS